MKIFVYCFTNFLINFKLLLLVTDPYNTMCYAVSHILFIPDCQLVTFVFFVATAACSTVGNPEICWR